jgi:acetolactate synthase-1/3 small subunit
VVKLIDLSESSHIERELMMVKVRASGPMRDEVKRLCDIFRGSILDVTPTTYVIEVTGEKSKLDAFLRTISEDLIIEVVRSGTTGMLRGERGLHA